MTAVSAQFATDLQVNMTPDTVSIRTSSTINNYGELSFSGDATSYDAYIRRINESDRNDIDDTIEVDWVVYIPHSTLTLDVDDQLTLPAPISETRPIVKVDTRRDPKGQVGVVAYVGRKRI